MSTTHTAPWDYRRSSDIPSTSELGQQAARLELYFELRDYLKRGLLTQAEFDRLYDEGATAK